MRRLYTGLPVGIGVPSQVDDILCCEHPCFISTVLRLLCHRHRRRRRRRRQAERK